MHPDERFAADSTAAVLAARTAFGGMCIHDYGGGRMPTVNISFLTIDAARAFNAALIHAMRGADAVDAMDAQQAAAGFGEPAIVGAA